MMTRDWTLDDTQRRDTRRASPPRVPEQSYGSAVAMAFVETSGSIPDDMMRLLARLG